MNLLSEQQALASAPFPHSSTNSCARELPRLMPTSSVEIRPSIVLATAWFGEHVASSKQIQEPPPPSWQQQPRAFKEDLIFHCPRSSLWPQTVLSACNGSTGSSTFCWEDPLREGITTPVFAWELMDRGAVEESHHTENRLSKNNSMLPCTM